MNSQDEEKLIEQGMGNFMYPSNLNFFQLAGGCDTNPQERVSQDVQMPPTCGKPFSPKSKDQAKPNHPAEIVVESPKFNEQDGDQV